MRTLCCFLLQLTFLAFAVLLNGNTNVNGIKQNTLTNTTGRYVRFYVHTLQSTAVALKLEARQLVNPTLLTSCWLLALRMPRLAASVVWPCVPHWLSLCHQRRALFVPHQRR